MSAVTIVVIVVAIAVVGLLAVGMRAIVRRQRLQQRFGPKYNRLTAESDSRRKAEAALAERERRARDLDIRPLTDSARESYAAQWAGIQEQFADTPADAVAASQELVVAAMGNRGYPVEHHDRVLADLSVEHAGTLDRYRAAEKISESAASAAASAEDLRLAMIDYRALFRDLLGDLVADGLADSPADRADGPAKPLHQERLTK
jgi:FtsZ-interacting cell division protein ZipA